MKTSLWVSTWMSILQVQDGQSWCFHNVTSTNATQTTSADCDPPLEYDCELVVESTELYSQETGSMYNCSAGNGAQGISPSQSAGTPVQTKSYQGVFEPNYTSGQGQAPGAAYQYARTPVLEAGQVKPHLRSSKPGRAP